MDVISVLNLFDQVASTTIPYELAKRIDKDGGVSIRCAALRVKLKELDSSLLYFLSENSVLKLYELYRLTEEEILTMPCYCICCYNVEATVVDLIPGPYTVEYCWYDYETDGEKCHQQDIVIP